MDLPLPLAEPLYLRTDYMIVGRIMSYVGPGYSFISHSKLTKIFVVADVIAILTQSGGGAMMVRPLPDLTMFCKNLTLS